MGQTQQTNKAFKLKLVTHLLVKKAIDVQWLHDVGRELRVAPCRGNLGKKQGPHRPLERRRNLLRLVRDAEAAELYVWFALLHVRLQEPSKHADKRRLACAVLAEHDDDLRVAEGAGLHPQEELRRARLAFKQLQGSLVAARVWRDGERG